MLAAAAEPPAVAADPRPGSGPRRDGLLENRRQTAHETSLGGAAQHPPLGNVAGVPPSFRTSYFAPNVGRKGWFRTGAKPPDPAVGRALGLRETELELHQCLLLHLAAALLLPAPAEAPAPKPPPAGKVHALAQKLRATMWNMANVAAQQLVPPAAPDSPPMIFFDFVPASESESSSSAPVPELETPSSQQSTAGGCSSTPAETLEPDD